MQFGDLARWVRDREIPLELSLSSNLQTGAIAAWGDTLADHPFDLLYQLGFAVTVNVDNRSMSATSLAAVGIGLICYGIFMMVRAKLAKM